MRLSQIIDMNVVANASAVRRWIIGAEDLQLRALSCRGSQRQRNQMGFGIVRFTDFAALIRPCGVEIAQTGKAQSVRIVVTLQSVLKKSFDTPYGFTGGRGRSSVIGIFDGLPYTAQVEEKINLRTPQSSAVLSSTKAASTLFWKYFRGFTTDSPT